MGVFMADCMQFANKEERLVAEKAILNFRELMGVMKNAPPGKAMAVMEQAVREKGFETVRLMNASGKIIPMESITNLLKSVFWKNSGQ